MATDDTRTPADPAAAVGARDPRAGALLPGADRSDRDETDHGGLPEHEIDDDRTLGGGVMSEAGTAVDRGTGELDGQAQGPEDDDDRAGAAPDVVSDEADAALGHDRRTNR